MDMTLKRSLSHEAEVYSDLLIVICPLSALNIKRFYPLPVIIPLRASSGR